MQQSIPVEKFLSIDLYQISPKKFKEGGIISFFSFYRDYLPKVK